jgi:hypothetical protein
VPATGTPPDVTVKVAEVMVAGSIAPLKVALTVPFTATPVALPAGMVLRTVGVLEVVGAVELEPQAAPVSRNSAAPSVDSMVLAFIWDSLIWSARIP